MGQAAPPHGVRIFFGHGILVSSRERRGDASRRALQLSPYMAPQAVPQRIETSRLRRLKHFDLAKRTPDRAEAAEPGVAGEIMRSGQSHGWRRRKSGAHANLPHLQRFRMEPSLPLWIRAGDPAVHLRNDADIPLEFEVKRASASVNGRVAGHNPIAKGGTAAADSVFGYMVGLAPLGVVQDGILEGEVEVEYIYGRPGKMKHRRTEALGVRAQTGPHGDVISKVMFVRELP